MLFTVQAELPIDPTEFLLLTVYHTDPTVETPGYVVEPMPGLHLEQEQLE